MSNHSLPLATTDFKAVSRWNIGSDFSAPRSPAQTGMKKTQPGETRLGCGEKNVFSSSGRGWTQPEHVEAARPTEFSVGAGETGCRKRGATSGGTQVWGGVEPSETLSNTTHRDRSGRDPNRPAERRQRDLDLPPVRHPSNDRLDIYQGPPVTASKSLHWNFLGIGRRCVVLTFDESFALGRALNVHLFRRRQTEVIVHLDYESNH